MQANLESNTQSLLSLRCITKSRVLINLGGIRSHHNNPTFAAVIRHVSPEPEVTLLAPIRPPRVPHDPIVLPVLRPIPDHHHAVIQLRPAFAAEHSLHRNRKKKYSNLVIFRNAFLHSKEIEDVTRLVHFYRWVVLEGPPRGFDGYTNGLVGHGLLEGSLVLWHVLVPINAHDLCIFLQKIWRTNSTTWVYYVSEYFLNHVSKS